MCEIIEKLCSEAETKGRTDGQARVNKLRSLLIDAGRYDDLKRSTTDINYQTQLMYELLPKEMA